MKLDACDTVNAEGWETSSRRHPARRHTAHWSVEQPSTKTNLFPELPRGVWYIVHHHTYRSHLHGDPIPRTVFPRYGKLRENPVACPRRVGMLAVDAQRAGRRRSDTGRHRIVVGDACYPAQVRWHAALVDGRHSGRRV